MSPGSTSELELVTPVTPIFSNSDADNADVAPTVDAKDANDLWLWVNGRIIVLKPSKQTWKFF
jgi:hypothetical protein